MRAGDAQLLQAVAGALGKLGIPSSLGTFEPGKYLNKLDEVAPFLKTGGKLLGKAVPFADIGFGLHQAFTADNAYTNGTDEGKVRIFNVLLSVNTGVCDRQTKKFNELAADLGPNIVIVTVSADLPPTLDKWCAAAGADRLVMASDYHDHSFAKGFGIWVADASVPARAVIVVDKNGRIAHMEVTPEYGMEPNYDAAVAAAKAAAA